MMISLLNDSSGLFINDIISSEKLGKTEGYVLHAPKLIGMVKFFGFFKLNISYFYNPRRYEHRRRPAFDAQMRNDPMGYRIERKIGRTLKNDQAQTYEFGFL